MDKPVVMLTKKNREKTQNTNTRNERGTSLQMPGT